MKKRYVISIITVLLITLSFFAYNKYSNKQEITNNKQIGIMLEDDYESGTYSLSDSSDIPNDEYIFNAEKTNQECSDATFSYDSINNKVLVNTNKSIQCNLYFKSNLLQLVNYQFLYDGSLGDAEANQMKDITGGWAGGWTQTYDNSGVVKNWRTGDYYDSYLYLHPTGRGDFVYLGTQKAVDLTPYSTLSIKYNCTRDSGGNQFIYCFSKNWDGEKETCATVGWNYIESNNYPSGNLILSENIKNINRYAYFLVNSANYSEREMRTYYVWLDKEDNWQEISSKIGVSVSSIEDLLNNYSTQILNNEGVVKYMIKQCTGNFMGNAIANSTFMNAYRSSPYKSLIDANVHWKKFIDMSTV